MGTKYISILLEKYNNTAIALTAYNAGIGTVDNWIEKGVIKKMEKIYKIYHIKKQIITLEKF